MEYRSSNSRASRSHSPDAAIKNAEEVNHLPVLSHSPKQRGSKQHLMGNNKDSIERALQRESATNNNSRGAQQQPSIYSQMGSGTSLAARKNRQALEGRSAARKNSLNHSIGSGIADMNNSAQRNQNQLPNNQPDIVGVLPRIAQQSTEDSEYLVLGNGALGKSHHSNQNESIAFLRKKQQQQQMRMTPDELASKQQMRSLSQVKSDEVFSSMNPRYEHSKHTMSPSPDLRITTHQMVSDRKKSVNKLYYTNEKKSQAHSRQPAELISSARYSYVDAPPIPQRSDRRYPEDVRHPPAASNKTSGITKNDNKQEKLSNDFKSHKPITRQEYLERTLDKKMKQQQNDASVKFSEHLDSAIIHRQDHQKIGGKSNANATKQRQGTEVRSSKNASQPHRHKEDVNSLDHGLYTSQVDQNENGSQLVRQSEVEQIQKSLQRQRVDRQGKAKRNINEKGKTMSNQSMVQLKNGLHNRMSPMGGEMVPTTMSQKYIMSQIDRHDYLTMQTDDLNSKNEANQINRRRDGAQKTLALGGQKRSQRRSDNEAAGSKEARHRNTHLFDVRSRSGLAIKGVKDGSSLHVHEDTLTDNVTANQDQSNDICTQIATQALSKCYNIVPQLARQLISDTREQISHYRKQQSLHGQPSWNKRVTLSQYESSTFYNTISDRVYQKIEQIIKNKSDLRPILNMILLGLQDYQAEKTKMDSLKCIKFLSGMNSGQFRDQIWHWSKYTTIQVQRQETGANKGFAKKQRVNASLQKQLHIVGFIQCMQNLMHLPDSIELSQLACRTLILIGQKQFFELYLGQLPSLFTDRVQYLSMMNENFQMFHRAMVDQVDEVERVPLLHQFVDLGIPNFLAAQCLCLIEISLMQQKETQLEGLIPTNIDQQPTKTSEQRSRIQNQQMIAIALLSEIWSIMPTIFSTKQPQTATMLQLEVDQEDFGLKDRLSQQSIHTTSEQKNRLLGSKVLSLFKKISTDGSLTVRVLLISRLFAILEKLTNEGDHFAETIYRLLIFFLIEWHENQILRHHLLTNFLDLFSQDKDLSLHQLVEPLCSIITINLKKDKIDENRYLTMNDYSFFWAMSQKNRITANGAQVICKIMQNNMLRRDPHFKVAEKIFFKLATKFANTQPICTLLSEHASSAINQLSFVDNDIKVDSRVDLLMSPKFGRGAAIESKRNTDKFEKQMQLHYLFKHLLMLARGRRAAGKQVINEEELPRDAAAFRDLYDHIVGTLRSTIKVSSAQHQSPALASLLKKLLESQEMADSRIKNTHNPNISYDSLSMDLNNAGVPSMNRLEEERAAKMQQQQLNKSPAPNKNSQETLQLNLGEDLTHSQVQTTQPEQINVMPIQDVSSSGVYDASHHPATIQSASRVFSHVNRVEREVNKRRRSKADMKIPEEDSSEHHASSKRRLMREMGTDYDPPMIKSKILSNMTNQKQHRSRSRQATLVDNDEDDNKDNDVASQTDPRKHNKKLQVGLLDTISSQNGSDYRDNIGNGLRAIQPAINERKEDDEPSVVGHRGINERDMKCESAGSSEFTSGAEDVPSIHPRLIFPIDEDEAEEQLSPTTLQELESQNKLGRVKSGAEDQTGKTPSFKKTETDIQKPNLPKLNLPSQESLQLKSQTVPNKTGAQTLRNQTDSQPEQVRSQVKRNKTQKLDVRNALKKIKQSLNSMTANLKNNSQPTTQEYGTTLRTEIYSSGSETSPVRQLQKVDDDSYNSPVPGTVGQKKQKPLQQRYGSNHKLLVTPNDDEPLKHAHGSKPRKKQPSNVEQNCQHCFAQGIRQSQHDTDACPHQFNKITKFVDTEPELQQSYRTKKPSNPKSISQSSMQIQNAREAHPIRDRLDFTQSPAVNKVDGSLSCKVLKINRLPGIGNAQHNEPNNGNIPSGHHFKNSSNAGNKLENLSVFAKAPPQRSLKYSGLPISLPKMSDFWRGNAMRPARYGDEINYLTPGGPAPTEASPTKYSPMQRQRTMSQKDDEEMSQMYAQHQRKLQEKQRQLVLKQSPERSMTYLSPQHRQINLDQTADQKSNSPQAIRKTGYSWISNKIPDIPATAQKPINDSRERKKEFKRLENALERLLINLGSDVDPSRYKSQDDQEEELKEIQQPPKTSVEDNKHGNNTMVSKLEDKSVEPERQMDSFTANLRNGSLGIASGLASPIKMEIQTEEEIDIVKPETFDRTHPGLVFLSPNQISQLKELADLRDNDDHMSPDENHDLDHLLDLLERGTPIDGRHPGMINLTPEQQKQFINTLIHHADKNNRPALNLDQKNQLNNLKNLIVHGIPLDSRHPGCINLAPNQKNNLIAIENRQARGQPLNPTEKDLLGQYKNIIAYGEPINSSHPGVINLTEAEKDRLLDLEEEPEEMMTPENRSQFDQIRNTIVEGTPLNENHPGIVNMAPFQLKRFKELSIVRDNRDLNPDEKRELTKLQEKLRNGDPIDERHAGMANLTPLQQDLAKNLLQNEHIRIQRAPEAQRMLDKLKNLIISGTPLDVYHPGMSHLTPNQIVKLKGILRRKSNGEPLMPDDKMILQKIQNLMQRGRPLDHDHPGFKKLKPKDQDQYLLLKSLREGGRNLSPESSDKFEKLAGFIQLNSGPFDQGHEGLHNLVPSEQDHLKDILSKQASQVPLSDSEKDNLGRIKEQMRPYIPYDRLHPGYDGLTPQEQLKLNTINKKIDSDVDLPPNEKADLQKIKDKMNNPDEIDETHPGWKNLTPIEKHRFRILRDNEDSGERVSPEDDKEMDSLKDIIKNGRTIDENHPGFENLNPEQQERFKELSKLAENGKHLTPDEQMEKDNLDDIIINGEPIGEKHRGFKGLDPYQKKRFTNLRESRDDQDLSPMQQKEFDQLRTNISPLQFSPDMAAALKNLQKRNHGQGDLNLEEFDQKARLEELKQNLPHIKEQQDGLTPEQKALLQKYLAMRLFEQPMTPAQEEELAFLLQRDKDVERNLQPDEQQRMKELVRIKYRGVELEPEEEKELDFLHRKQNHGIGGLTPGQYSILQQLKDYKEMGQPLNNKMEQSLDFLLQLQALPSQLNPPNETELGQMEDKNKRNDISSPVKNRLKAFWRMKYHPQLMNLEDRALFYLMKDLESMPALTDDQESMLFALQRKFNCLPYITPEQESYMDRLENENKTLQLSPEQMRDLERLRQLAKPDIEESDIPGLNAADCRDYKLLKAKHDRGEAMTPEEIARYRDLRDKLRQLKDEEEKANQMRTPTRGPPSSKSGMLKTPDAAAPSEKRSKQNLDAAKSPLNGSSQGGGDISSAGQFGDNPDRKTAQIQFKRAMRNGTCTLKELIDQFYLIEDKFLIKTYHEGLDTTFKFAQATSQGFFKVQGEALSLRPLTLKDFLRYAETKKIKFKQHNVVEILRDQSRQDDISLTSFVKLLILASCGGDKQKIGISNFKKLMNHMDIFK